MTEEIIIAGFGGQGVLSMGKILAYSGVMQDQEVAWFPSYGPEMRGGTANVMTVVADDPIASPIVSYPDILIALNQPSLDKFGPSVRPGGLVIINTDMCPHGIKRDDVKVVAAPMSAIAQEIGSPMVLNMVAIGIAIGKTGIIKYETLEDDLNSYMKAKNPDLLAMNLKAIKRGMEQA